MDTEHENQDEEEVEEPITNALEEPTEPDDVEAMRSRLTIAEQELADAQAALHERDEQLGALQAELGAPLERYRASLLASNPDVPQDMVDGTSIASLDESFNAASALAERLRRQVEERTAQERVPAGAPTRCSLDVSALTPQQKIMKGLVLHP